MLSTCILTNQNVVFGCSGSSVSEHEDDCLVSFPGVSVVQDEVLDYAELETELCPAGHMSLEGVHSSVPVPSYQTGFWKQWRAYVGPAILVSIGYMDPGNWGTDLQSGAQFKYEL